MDLNDVKTILENASKSIDTKRELTEMENSATDKFYEDIKGYENHEKYNNIKEYVEVITNPKCKVNCLILEGEQGIGKSTIIKSIIKELGKEICYINSYTTSLSFYKTLYLNRFRTIVLDDVFGIFGDERGIAILRAITNTEKIRYVKYDSTSDKLDVPSNFNFEGSIIILTNELTPAMNDSLLNRAIHRKIVFSLEEKFEFMERVAKFNYPQMNLREIIDFIKANVNETTRNFTFRSVIKIVEFYLHSKSKWKEMALEELESDEELVYIQKIQNIHTEERNRLWFKETGKSIRTLQRKLKILQDRTTKRHPVNSPKENQQEDNTLVNERGEKENGNKTIKGNTE